MLCSFKHFQRSPTSIDTVPNSLKLLRLCTKLCTSLTEKQANVKTDTGRITGTNCPRNRHGGRKPPSMSQVTETDTRFASVHFRDLIFSLSCWLVRNRRPRSIDEKITYIFGVTTFNL